MEIVTSILLPAGVVTALGLIFGLLLAIAGKAFAVEKDTKAEALTEMLPGANCGGCGYSGCAEYAKAVSKGEAPLNKCPVGGDSSADKMAAFMGVAPSYPVRMRAQVLCSGTRSLSNRKYNYVGLSDCLSVAKLGNGPKECRYGCIGLGTCVKKCAFDAIKIENGVAVVEYEKCRACGVCVDSCPQKIIRLIPFDTDVWVGCASKDRGTVVRSHCKVGCIGCGLCEKACPEGAISLEEGIAVIDYAKCINCGACAEACPRRIIWSGKKQIKEGDTLEAPAKTEEN